MDWIALLRSLIPSLHEILHYLDNLLHRKTGNRELEFVYSNVNSTDLNSITDTDAAELLKNLIKKN